MSPLLLARMRTSCRLLRSTTVIIFFCTVLASSAMMVHEIFEAMEFNSTCDELDCQNSNSCQMSITNDSETSGLNARCACRGRWAGPKCELELHLSALTIQSQSVLLALQEVAPNAPETRDVASPSETDLHLEELTLFLWDMNSTDICRLLHLSRHNVENGELHAKGLERGRRYLLCVSNGHLDSCSSVTGLNMEYLPKEPNCVELITMLDNRDSQYIKILIVTCVTAIFLLALIVFMYLHRRTIVCQMCLHVLFCRRRNCCRSRWKHTNTRRMRKEMRKLSGNVLMPDDIPVDFEEFEGENDLCSPMYSCDGLGYMESNSTLTDLKPPSRPTSLDVGTVIGDQTNKDPCALLYDNQDLITPIYSPQDHNVMKLAFLEEDWTSGNQGEVDNQERIGDSVFMPRPEDALFLHPQVENSVFATLQAGLPLHQSYPSEFYGTENPALHSQTLPRRFLPTTSPPIFPHTYSTNRKRPSSFSSYSSQYPAYMPSKLATPNCEFSPDVDPFLDFQNELPLNPPAAISPNLANRGGELSPEIEYSDASGDYQYFLKPKTMTLRQQRNLIRNQHRHSFIGRDVMLRNPKFARSARYNRPFSMPAGQVFLPPSVASTPRDPPSFDSFSGANHPCLQSDFRYLERLARPLSYIPSVNGFPYTNPYVMDPLEWRYRQRGKPSLFKQRSCRTPSPNYMEFQKSFPLEEICTSNHTLPRAKKPKLPHQHVSFDDPDTGDNFASHTLPRARKSKSSLTPRTAKRPQHLSLRGHATNLPRRPKSAQLTFPTANYNLLNQPCNPQKPSESSTSLPSSPSKPTSSKSAKTLISHIENSLFFRKNTKDPGSKSENQEFLDLQSPLVEDRARPSSKGKSKKKSRSTSFRILSNSSGSEFTSLADNTYKCFFKTEEEESEAEEDKEDISLSRTSSSSHHTCDEISTKSENDADSALSNTKSVSKSSTKRPFSLSDSISCFAEDTVNLVTPFCTEIDSPASEPDEEDTYNDVSSIRASSETLKTEDIFDEGRAGNELGSFSEETRKNYDGVMGTELEPLYFVAEPEYWTDQPEEWEVML
ncbi:hypothetical protein RRG08_031020 [Elysia crispata]|uniref:EGF-like domain-containing protein n=1 Tax=Elysia crispata TaxID=231223 RepID=A0AAE1ADZ9_9GAST|nr:hypothetical protein RRG08_031020 [Elysia crispata]